LETLQNLKICSLAKSILAVRKRKLRGGLQNRHIASDVKRGNKNQQKIHYIFEKPLPILIDLSGH